MLVSRSVHGFALIALAGIAATSLDACAQPAPAEAPHAQPPPIEHVKLAPANTFKDAEQLLDALETADRGLVSLTADIVYTRVFELQGDTQERRGRLGFVNASGDEKKKRQFAIRFDQLIVGDVLREEEQIYVFDGQWLIEKNADQKKVARWQVAPPGKPFDPLRLGSGPLPIPIGQKRADITQRFDATLVPPIDGLDGDAHAKNFVNDSWEVLLRPRADHRDLEDDFKEIRLWYVRSANGRLLPKMARTVNQAGDVALVMLLNVETQDAGAPANVLAEVKPELLDIRVPSGWTEDVHPWRERTAQEPVREGPDAGEP